MPRVYSQATLFNIINDDSMNTQKEIIRKSSSTLYGEGIIPIPIQIFLWRQSE